LLPATFRFRRHRCSRGGRYERCRTRRELQGGTLMTRSTSPYGLRSLVCAGAFFAAVISSGMPAFASVAVYVGKNLTEDGSVLLAGYGDEPSSHWLSIVPARKHAPGSTVRVGATETADLPGQLIEIPQAAETFRYISMDYSYYKGVPAPLTNGGMNEQGLAVRDVALFSRRELVEMTPPLQRGPNYSDLARIALERARTAREAVEILSMLIDTYGYTTYGGNSHVSPMPMKAGLCSNLPAGRAFGLPGALARTMCGSIGAATTASVTCRSSRTIGTVIRITSRPKTSYPSRQSTAGTIRGQPPHSM
jgi:hypothetical protein